MTLLRAPNPYSLGFLSPVLYNAKVRTGLSCRAPTYSTRSMREVNREDALINPLGFDPRPVWTKHYVKNSLGLPRLNQQSATGRMGRLTVSFKCHEASNNERLLFWIILYSISIFPFRMFASCQLNYYSGEFGISGKRMVDSSLLLLLLLHPRRW